MAKNARGVLESTRKIIDLRDGPRPSLASSLIDQLLPTIWLAVDMGQSVRILLITIACYENNRFYHIWCKYVKPKLCKFATDRQPGLVLPRKTRPPASDVLLDITRAANSLKVSNRALRHLCPRRLVSYAKVNYRNWRLRKSGLEPHLKRSSFAFCSPSCLTRFLPEAVQF